MDNIPVKDIAKKWGISIRRVNALCNEGRIEGATRFGNMWSIPASDY